MRCVFELYHRVSDDAYRRLHVIEEICPPPHVPQRAKRLLWTLALDRRQEMIVVYDADTRHEIYRRSVRNGSATP